MNTRHASHACSVAFRHGVPGARKQTLMPVLFLLWLPCACSRARHTPGASQMFFRGTGRQHWLSYDQGAKYQPLDPSFSIKEVKMHPTESEWMLASHLTDGCKKASRTECAMEVYLTQDLGKTWRLLQRYVAQFEWAPVNADGSLKPGMTKESIFMVTYGMTSGNQPFGVWSALAQFARSDDLWKTKYAHPRALTPTSSASRDRPPLVCRHVIVLSGGSDDAGTLCCHAATASSSWTSSSSSQ
jgi:hypothetical protein